MSDLKELEFLASKSKELVEKQVESYRHKKSNAGTIIGVISLFIPFFLNGLGDANFLIQYLSILPIGLLAWSLLLMLKVFRTELLYQFFSVEKFKDLVNKDYEKVLLYEIGANNDSYRDNEPIDVLANKNYNFGIKLTTISVLISIALLLTNNFSKSEQQLLKVHIVNLTAMSDKGKDKPRVIPTVPPRDRGRLNEGVDRPQTAPAPKPIPPKQED